MKAPDLKTGQMVTIAYIIGILVVLFIVYKILAGVGLIKTAKKKKEEAKKEEVAEELRTMDYFDPLFLQGKSGWTKIGSSRAAQYAADFRNMMRGLGTNEEGIYSVFGRLKNKYNISEISFEYTGKYNRDLLTDLLNELTDAEQVTMFDIIDKLPEK